MFKKPNNERTKQWEQAETNVGKWTKSPQWQQPKKVRLMKPTLETRGKSYGDVNEEDKQ